LADFRANLVINKNTGTETEPEQETEPEPPLWIIHALENGAATLVMLSPRQVLFTIPMIPCRHSMLIIAITIDKNDIYSYKIHAWWPEKQTNQDQAKHGDGDHCIGIISTEPGDCFTVAYNSLEEEIAQMQTDAKLSAIVYVFVQHAIRGIERAINDLSIRCTNIQEKINDVAGDLLLPSTVGVTQQLAVITERSQRQLLSITRAITHCQRLLNDLNENENHELVDDDVSADYKEESHFVDEYLRLLSLVQTTTALEAMLAGNNRRLHALITALGSQSSQRMYDEVRWLMGILGSFLPIILVVSCFGSNTCVPFNSNGPYQVDENSPLEFYPPLELVTPFIVFIGMLAGLGIVIAILASRGFSKR